MYKILEVTITEDGNVTVQVNNELAQETLTCCKSGQCTLENVGKISEAVSQSLMFILGMVPLDKTNISKYSRVSPEVH